MCCASTGRCGVGRGNLRSIFFMEPGKRLQQGTNQPLSEIGRADEKGEISHLPPADSVVCAGRLHQSDRPTEQEPAHLPARHRQPRLCSNTQTSISLLLTVRGPRRGASLARRGGGLSRRGEGGGSSISPPLPGALHLLPARTPRAILSSSEPGKARAPLDILRRPTSDTAREHRATDRRSIPPSCQRDVSQLDGGTEFLGAYFCFTQVQLATDKAIFRALLCSDLHAPYASLKEWS